MALRGIFGKEWLYRKGAAARIRHPAGVPGPGPAPGCAGRSGRHQLAGCIGRLCTAFGCQQRSEVAADGFPTWMLWFACCTAESFHTALPFISLQIYKTRVFDCNCRLPALVKDPHSMYTVGCSVPFGPGSSHSFYNRRNTAARSPPLLHTGERVLPVKILLDQPGDQTSMGASAVRPITKQRHAVGHLFSYAIHFHQFCQRRFVRQQNQRLQVQRTAARPGAACWIYRLRYPRPQSRRSDSAAAASCAGDGNSDTRSVPVSTTCPKRSASSSTRYKNGRYAFAAATK